MRLFAMVLGALFCMVTLFDDSCADVSNEIDIHFTFSDSDTKVEVEDESEEGDARRIQMSLTYTRFFEKLVDDESPIGLREFYTHPSKVFVGGGYDEKKIQWILPAVSGSTPIVIQDLKQEVYTAFGGGKFYFPTNTGVGVAGGIDRGEWEDINDTSGNIEGSFVSGSIDQYIAKVVNLSGGYAYKVTDFEEYETEENRIFGQVTAAIGKKVPFWVNAFYAYGKRDDQYSSFTEKWTVQNAQLELGHFWHNLSILYGADYEIRELKDSDAETKIITAFISPQLWHNEHYLTALTIFGRRYDNDEDDPFGRPAEFREDELGFNIQVSFRF